MTNKLTVLDLFAGAGGLSLGFEQTGMFEVIAAVEINKNARKTYETNNRNVKIYGDITKIDYNKIKKRFGEVNVVIGGPPCQGFSNANRQKNNLISDNNSLVKHFIRAVEELKPNAFVMENVKTMGSESHKFFLINGEKEEIERLGVNINLNEIVLLGELNQLTFEVYNTFETRQNIEPYILKKEAYSKLNLLQKAFSDRKKFDSFLEKESNFWENLFLDNQKFQFQFLSENHRDLWNRIIERYKNKKFDNYFIDCIDCFLNIQRMFFKVREIREHNLQHQFYADGSSVYVKLSSYNIFQYLLQKFKDLGYAIDSGILKAVEFGVPQHRERLFIAGSKASGVCDILPKNGFLDFENYYTIADAISDIEEIEPVTVVTDESIIKNNFRDEVNAKNPLFCYLNDTPELSNHIMTATGEVAKERFKKLKPGESFKNLSDEYKTTYSDPNRTQKTVYHRLDYKVPCRTVINVRKSMWVHPKKDRAISIREAARLQSFPDSYKFVGTKDSQYQQVGNAVPPLLGRAVAEQLLKVMGYEIPKPLCFELSKSKTVLT